MSTRPILRDRPWDSDLAPIFEMEHAGRHVVLDDVLVGESLERLRTELLSSGTWHYRAQPGKVLCQELDVEITALGVADEIAQRLRMLDPDLVTFERWAFLHQRPFEEFVHTDVGAYVFTLWLTPERWDLSPKTSGLRLYSLARPTGMSNSREETSRFFQAEGPPTAAYVRYRENRAVVFPASTFHSIGPCHFEGSAANRMRCSMTVILDHPHHWRQQHQRAQ